MSHIDRFRPVDKTPVIKIIDETGEEIRRFISLPHESTVPLLALWAAGTYLHSVFDCYPYLYIRSTGPACGKTKLLELMGFLSLGSPRPLVSINPATIYRAAGAVMLVDDADYLGHPPSVQTGEICAVLNAGHCKVAAVPRYGTGSDVTYHEVYGPRAFTGMGSLPAPLAHRCFHIHLDQSLRPTPSFQAKDCQEKFRTIRHRFQCWASRYSVQAAEMYSQLPLEMKTLADYDPRFQDMAKPLLVLAQMADQESGGTLVVPKLINAFENIAPDRKVSRGDIA